MLRLNLCLYHVMTLFACISTLLLQVQYSIFLSGMTSEVFVDEGACSFVPSTLVGWGEEELKVGNEEDSPPLSWEAFWGEGSPYCRDGVVQGRLTLRLPEDAGSKQAS